MNIFCRLAQNDFVRLAVLAALLGATVAHAEPVPASVSAAAASDNSIEDAGPVFNAGSQYTAVYHPGQGQWRFLPLTGQDLAIATGGCATGTVPHALAHGRGVWLVTRDDAGRLELVAPSTTELPAGAPDTVAVRSCDEPEAGALVLPQPLIDLLAADAGAVLVE